MNHKLRKLALVTTAALLLTGSASAISFSGNVAAKNTLEIYAPIGGTVESVEAGVGQRVQAGDVLATLTTTKVYTAEGRNTKLHVEEGERVHIPGISARIPGHDGQRADRIKSDAETKWFQHRFYYQGFQSCMASLPIL